MFLLFCYKDKNTIKISLTVAPHPLSLSFQSQSYNVVGAIPPFSIVTSLLPCSQEGKECSKLGDPTGFK